MTVAADVYSYGIVLWEIAFRRLPYSLVFPPDYSPGPSEIPNAIIRGTRPRMLDSSHRPIHAPIGFAEIMVQCWAGRSDARPSFTQILAALDVIAQQGSSNIHLVNESDLVRPNDAAAEEDVVVDLEAVSPGGMAESRT